MTAWPAIAAPARRFGPGAVRQLLAHLVLWLAIVLPVAGALVWQLLFSLGVHPGRDMLMPGFTNFALLFAQPALLRSLGLSLATALTATLLAVALVALLASCTSPTRLMRRCRPWMALLLSTPYLAFVIGWQFVVAPSGLLARLVAQFSGSEIPPAIATVPDSWFIGYVLLLAIKESGFLLMLLLLQLQLVPVNHYYHSAQALGYSTPCIWRKVLFPILYPRLRLGIWALLVYAATNIEVALFAAPNLPQLISLRLVEWFTHPNLDYQLIAAAGVVVCIAAISLLLGCWVLGEKLLARWLRPWLVNTRRGAAREYTGWFTRLHTTMLGIYLLPLLLMCLWSCTRRWQYPQLLPEPGLAWWMRGQTWAAVFTSLKLAVLVAVLALGMALVFVQCARLPLTGRQLWLLYLPLMIPQLALGAGLAINAHLLGVNGSLGAVTIGHLIQILPYMVLILAPVWHMYDGRYSLVAASLGHSPWKVWRCVKLPVLIRPVLFALALGISVSVNLYVPTIFLGEGRIGTLMTEMVGLGASHDRRIMGVFSVWLTLLPLLAFALASAWPHWRYGQVRAQH